MSVFYQSTRGKAPELDLAGVTLTGLADDGGLYIPQKWPTFSADNLLTLEGQSYIDVAVQVLKPFVEHLYTEPVLRALLGKAYAGFTHPDIAPLHPLSDNFYVLELFHGPTLAFKDIALQLLGQVFEYLLARTGNTVTVVGATSGDTGSAAIAALAHRKNIEVYILYPHIGPSDIQRRQMTCVDAPNIHAVAIEGSFDDCQHIVKSLFNDPDFRQSQHLAAVNSINWLRILAQMVYYFYAASVIGTKRAISFVVPSGNFGNIYAAYAATRCGLLASKLAVASNKNNVLTRFFNSGRMHMAGVQQSLSPSMDIEVSSNFERLLFDLCQHDSEKVRRYMQQQKAQGEFTVSPVELATARQLFTAADIQDDETIATIRSVYDDTGYILDPHSAVGVAAAKKLSRELPTPIVSLACAHPAKFPDTIERAIGLRPSVPDSVAALLAKAERTLKLQANVKDVANLIQSKAK